MVLDWEESENRSVAEALGVIKVKVRGRRITMQAGRVRAGW